MISLASSLCVSVWCPPGPTVPRVAPAEPASHRGVAREAMDTTPRGGVVEDALWRKRDRGSGTGSNVRRAEGPCLLQVKVLSGKLSVRPGSYRGGEEGNRIAEALGTSGHQGWVCESTGRNANEARAGLERDVVSADLPFEQGRSLDPAGATDP